MNPAIVSSPHPVVLLGGVKPAPPDLSEALNYSNLVVCADGGADHALAAGLWPAAVIGDMDSLSVAAQKAFAPVLYPVSEQDSTDFDKALRHITAPLVLGVGFSGVRLDHELGSLAVLARYPDRRCILIGPDTIVALCPPELRVDVAAGTQVSLFPMSDVGVQSSGLRWPTDGLRFAPDGRIGTSNEALGPVTLVPDAPKMLVIMPRAALAALVAAMQESAATWSARAG